MSLSTETRPGGRYVLRQKLSEGGMGVVHRATDRLTQETIALKQITVPTEQLRFATRALVSKSSNLRLALAQEFRTLASLRHPHIIKVLDYGFDEQRQPYLTMELLENAANLLEAGRGLSRLKQIELLVQLLQALSYLHRRGIIHRDLKPDNVLVVEGQVKVLDFGLAVAREYRTGQDYDIYGTPAYMAPELLAGQPASEASDLYAVGIMAYELFAGEHPFDTTSLGTLMAEIVSTVPDTRSLGLGDQLSNVLGRLLSKRPEARYNDARELINLYGEVTGQPALVVETRAVRDSYLQAAQFVGREAELQQLATALDAARKGEGSAWLVGGESGVGKSRLLDEFRTQALVDGALVLWGQAIPEGATPYRVWREVYRRLCLESDLSDLEAGVLKALVPDISRLLDRDVPDAPALAPQAAYERLQNTILALVQRQVRPVVIILEDVQWIGDESLTVLRRIQQGLANTSVLLLASYRDDERPRLPEDLPHMQFLKLPRLTADGIAKLSQSMLGEAGKQPELVRLLEQETEGNAFFIVEVVRTLAEEAGRLDRITSMRLPRTVFAGRMQAVVERRLRQVPTHAYPLLNAAAVAGRQIDARLLRDIDPETDVEAWLDRCAEASVLEVQEGRWRFSHDKLREGVLIKLLADEQKRLHQEVAEAIEQVYAADLSLYYARLAYHWCQIVNEDGSDPALVIKAVDYLQKAGEQAVRSSANQEAVRFYSQAVDLLTHLPETPERFRKELGLHIRTGPALLATKGWAAPEAGEVYRRARELSRQVADTPELFAALWGLWIYHATRGEWAPTRELMDELLRLARQRQDPDLLLEAHHVAWGTTIWTGEFAASYEHVQQGLAIYSPKEYHSHAMRFGGHDPGVCGKGHGALLLWLLGHADRAQESSQQALTLAEGLAHTPSRMHALNWAMWVHQFRREPQRVLERADAVIALAAEQGSALYLAMGTVFRGWAMAANGRIGEGMALLHQGLAMHRATGATYNRSYFVALQTEAYGTVGQATEGLDLIADALALAEAGESWCESELYRIKGTLLQALGDQNQAEACFRKAVDTARHQSARFFELRSAVSLGRLWQQRGEFAEAYELLAPIYDWFTEGFETADLKEARVFLEELER